MPIVDAEHRVREIYFLSNKEAPTTLQVFDKYRCLYETQTGKKIKRVRFDGEFDASKDWGDYCIEHGIRVEPTPPYSSQANGIAERSIGIITANIQTLLIDADLPKQYWADLQYTPET